MSEARDMIQEQTGIEPGVGFEVDFRDLPGVGFEVDFRDMDLPKKGKNKVGFKTSLTDFYKAARRRSFTENPIAPNQAD